MRNLNKILLIRFSSLGDIVLATPLIRMLRTAYPVAQIDFMVKREYAEKFEIEESQPLGFDNTFAILVRGESGGGQSLRLAYNILQAAGCRSFKTDYVACPSCGRTLFNLQTVTARIKTRTEHLKGVKIAIMGCIVNGPGEMADADFGYVGGAPGKINLYVGKQPIKFNIPEVEAVDRLVDLIREHGKWVEPEGNDTAVPGKAMAV